jgi:hypothetical protein
MDEQERDYLRQQIRQFEQSKRRWKLATITLAAALAIFLVVGAASSFLFGIGRLQQARMMAEMERARAAEAEARLQMEQARGTQMLRQAAEATGVQPNNREGTATKEKTPKEEDRKP